MPYLYIFYYTSFFLHSSLELSVSCQQSRLHFSFFFTIHTQHLGLDRDLDSSRRKSRNEVCFVDSLLTIPESYGERKRCRCRSCSTLQLRAAERKWQKSNDPSDMSMYQSLLSSFSPEVHIAKSSHFHNEINSAPDMRNLFRTFNYLFCPPSPPL